MTLKLLEWLKDGCYHDFYYSWRYAEFTEVGVEHPKRIVIPIKTRYCAKCGRRWFANMRPQENGWERFCGNIKFVEIH